MKSKLTSEFVNKLKFFLDRNTKKSYHYLHEPYIPKMSIKKISNTIEKNYISLASSETSQFIKYLKKITNSKYICLVNSGTSALHLSLITLGANKDTEILIPSFNYVAAANAVLMSNSSPHFVDIDESLSINYLMLDSYLKKICKFRNKYCYNKKNNKRILACILLYLYGYLPNTQKIVQVLKKYNILLIEDAAEALGSFLNSQHAGTFGDIGILSFNGNKIITTGAGGAILTNKKNIYEKCFKLSNVSKLRSKFYFIHDQLGFNYKMPNINAALGLSQIIFFSKILTSKKKLSNNYKIVFKDFLKKKIFKILYNRDSNSWLNVIIFSKKYKYLRNPILKLADKKKIQLRPAWNPLHTFKYLKKYPRMKMWNSKSLADRVLCLPSSPHFFYEKK